MRLAAPSAHHNVLIKYPSRAKDGKMSMKPPPTGQRGLTWGISFVKGDGWGDGGGLVSSVRNQKRGHRQFSFRMDRPSSRGRQQRSAGSQ